MADDEDDVRAEPGPEELLSPPGPRRSNFTPPPADAESLEAAANLFGDDAIAAALAAELARVATGPIPVRVPGAPAAAAPIEAAEPVTVAASPSVPEPVAVPAAALPVDESPIAEAPVAEAGVVAEAPVAEAPVADTPAAESVAPEPEPEPAAPAAAGPPDWASSLFGQPVPTVRDETSVPTPDPFAPSAPSFAPATGSFPPPSVVDGVAGSSALTTDPEELRALYRGAPAPTVPPADAPPPPGYASPATAGGVVSSPVVSAPAPLLFGSEPSAPTTEDGPPQRRSLPDDELVRQASDDPKPADTLDAIEQLQAQLHLREQEAREFAVWESSMQAIGTPEALAEIARARAELEAAPPIVDVRAPVSAPTPSVAPPEFAAPPSDEPAAFLPPPLEEPVAFLAPTADEPAAFLPPPSDEPAAYLSPPADEPAAFLPPPSDEPVTHLLPPPDDAAPLTSPPTDQPAAFLPPPSGEPTGFLPPPEDEPAAFLPPPAEEPAAYLPPPADEPAAFLPPPADGAVAYSPPAPEEHAVYELPVDEPFPTLTPPAEDGRVSSPSDPYFSSASQPGSAPAWELPVTDGYVPDAPYSDSPPPGDESPFAGFAPPADEQSFNTFAAPADPRDLQFDPQPLIPDAPVFIEPGAYEPPSFEPPSFEQPAYEPPLPAVEPAPEPVPAPPALVEPAAPLDGVAELYRAAGEVPPPVTVSTPPATDVPVTPAPTAQFEPAPLALPAPPDGPVPPAAAAPPSAFEDLLGGLGDPAAPAAGTPWIAPDPAATPAPGPVEDTAPGRRPFGEGVERDDAVDPSDSIFGAAPAPVSVNTAGVAIVPQYVQVESQPIRLVETGAIPTLLPQTEHIPPKIVPAEPIGLEPTPEEQRVGRSARLFWLWFAPSSSIVAIVFGTIIFALGVSLRQAIVATLAGVALSFIPLGLGTLAGKRSGQPTMVISRATFGPIGNILPAILALFSRLLWAAALLWILGKGVSEILIGAQLSGGFTEDELTLITIALGFVIAVVIAYFGYGLIAISQLVITIISGFAIIGFIALTVQYVNIRTALTTPDGPWILVVTGAVLVFSFVGLAWANTGADVARYQRPGASGAASMLWATFGAALPSFVLIAYGALLAASNHTLAKNIGVDPLDSLGRLLPVWYPAPLLAATALSLISGVVLSMYSGGFALQSAGLRLRRSLSTLVVGLLVIIIAISIDFLVTDPTQLLRDVATTVAVPIAAWVGIFVVETMIRRRPLDAPSLLGRGGVYPDIRWFNFLALILVSGVGFGFLSATMPALSWEGYAFSAFGVSRTSDLAQSDLGVLVALVLGMLVALATGFTAVRRQEGPDEAAE